MNSDTVKVALREYLDQRNYIAAVAAIRSLETDDGERIRLTGEVAGTLASEIDTARSAGRKKEAAVLEAALGWLLELYPELARHYRRSEEKVPPWDDHLMQLLRPLLVRFSEMREFFEEDRQSSPGEEPDSEQDEGQAERMEETIRQGVEQFEKVLHRFGRPEEPSRPMRNANDPEEPGQRIVINEDEEG